MRSLIELFRSFHATVYGYAAPAVLAASFGRGFGGFAGPMIMAAVRSGLAPALAAHG